MRPDKGTNPNRSELLEVLLQPFFRLHSQVGASEALHQVKYLGTQMALNLMLVMPFYVLGNGTSLTR